VGGPLVDIHLPAGVSDPQASTAGSTTTSTSSSQGPGEAAAEAEGRSGKSDANVFASPAVRRLARELDVDLSLLQGSGPNGRIVKEDVEAFASGMCVVLLHDYRC
jgi:pyruvate/2-oxoglutarate dehydrogenase complex dihydrolipoamide acyltransferase (E2) component